MTVYATTTKKKISYNLTLVRFFDVGVNLEGFWNYDKMALQVEDVYNVLSVKYPEYDFQFILDQSSGHGKTREGSLNVNLMSMKLLDKRNNQLTYNIIERFVKVSKMYRNIGDQYVSIQIPGMPFKPFY